MGKVMNILQFKRAMCCGLGKCITELSATVDIIRYKNIVLWGCLHNLSYDVLFEGTRAYYVYQLTEFFNDEMYFLQPLSKKFSELLFVADSGTFAHCCELLCQFAKNGNVLADSVLNEKYDALLSFLLKVSDKKARKKASANFETISISLNSLHGFAFFCKSCKDIGSLLLRNKDADFTWFLCNGESKFGKKRIEKFLKQKSTEGEEYDIFYKIMLTKGDKTKPEEKERTAAKLIKKLEKGTDGFIDRFHLRYTINEEQSKLIADMLKHTRGEKRTAQLLQCFSGDCPLKSEVLIDFYEKGGAVLKNATLRILSERKETGLREFALKLLTEDKVNGKAVQLMLSNCLPGDEKILLSVLKKLKIDYKNSENWHSAFTAVLAAASQKIKISEDVLLYIYENSLCSLCRADTLRLLAKRRWLSEDILNECLHDSDCNIRLWAEKETVKRGKTV